MQTCFPACFLEFKTHSGASRHTQLLVSATWLDTNMHTHARRNHETTDELESWLTHSNHVFALLPGGCSPQGLVQELSSPLQQQHCLLLSAQCHIQGQREVWSLVRAVMLGITYCSCTRLQFLPWHVIVAVILKILAYTSQSPSSQ